jgi:hypothetical protein
VKAPPRCRRGFVLTTRHSGSELMKLVAEYLERSVHFARMAAEADDPDLKEQLLKQAAAYRKLAEKRAALLERPESN